MKDKVLKKLSSKRKSLAILMVLVISLSTGSVFLGASSTPDNSASLANLASRATAYYQAALLGDAEGGFPFLGDKPIDFTADSDETKTDADVSMVNAGGMVGYLDRDFVKEIFAMVSSGASYSSNSFAYDTPEDIGGTPLPGVGEYLNYGKALGSLGLDSGNVSAFSYIFMRIGHFIAGILMIIAYTASLLSDLAFEAVFEILKLLNIFQFFDGAVSGLDVATQSSGFASLVKTFTDLFRLFRTIAIAIVLPFTVLTIIWGFVFNGVGVALQRMRKLGMMIIFILVIIPFVGNVYTDFLDDVTDSDSGIGVGATSNIITSTFIDFETWATDYGLALPAGVTIELDDEGNVTGDTALALSSIAQNINYMTSNGVIGSNTAQAADDIENWSPTETTGDATSTVDQTATVATMDILTDYMTTDLISASDYEAMYKSDSAAMGELANTVFYYKDKIDKWNSGAAFVGTTNGTVDDGYAAGGEYDVLTNGNESCLAFDGTKYYSDSNCDGKRGLSTLSTYNYLTSYFGESSISIGSPTKSSTERGHTSVVVVGSNPLEKLLRYVNAFVLLLSVSVLGFLLAGGLLFGTIKDLINGLMAIPFAVMGLGTAMVRFLSIVAGSFIKIILTLVLYTFFTTLILSFNDMIIVPLSHTLLAPFAGGVMMFTFGVLVPLIASIVLNIILVIFLLRVKSSVFKMINEWINNLIAQLIQPDKKGPAPADVQTPNIVGSAMRGYGSMKAMQAATGLGKNAASHIAGSKIAGSKDGGKDGEGGIPQLPGTDENGNAVDSTGALVDDGGNVIDENGKPVMTDGEPTPGTFVDADGNTVDKDGNRLDSSGNLMTGEDGNPVAGKFKDNNNKDVNKQGQLLNSDGSVKTDADGNPLQGSFNELNGDSGDLDDVTVGPDGQVIAPGSESNNEDGENAQSASPLTAGVSGDSDDLDSVGAPSINASTESSGVDGISQGQTVASSNLSAGNDAGSASSEGETLQTDGTPDDNSDAKSDNANKRVNAAAYAKAGLLGGAYGVHKHHNKQKAAQAQAKVRGEDPNKPKPKGDGNGESKPGNQANAQPKTNGQETTFRPKTQGSNQSSNTLNVEKGSAAAPTQKRTLDTSGSSSTTASPKLKGSNDSGNNGLMR